MRLRVRCDPASAASGPGTTLKQALLTLVARLLEPQGAISLAMGPLDAQCCLLGTLLALSYDGLERMHTPLAIINSTGTELPASLSGVSGSHPDHRCHHWPPKGSSVARKILLYCLLLTTVSTISFINLRCLSSSHCESNG